ncbi:MAG: DUF4038 domain-containing protein [Acidimicrobiales bacterium]
MSSTRHSKSLSAAALFAVLLLVATLLAVVPAGAHHDNTVTQPVVAYDTAWELGARATRAEMITYLDHIDQAGFTGFWFSYLSSTGLALSMANPNGNVAASYDQGQDQWTLGQGYADDISWMLDRANDRGLRVGFVAAWAVRYVHGDWPNGAPCQNQNQGPLKASNSYDFGSQLAADFASHSAVQYWVMGGDNFCAAEDPTIWANMSQGLRDGGAQQPITYHSSPLGDRYTEFAGEPWMDFLAIETGHCMTASRLEQVLGGIINNPSKSHGKPVFAAEMRYEGFEPDWQGCAEHGPGRPVEPSHIDADTRAALRAGVSGMLFGNDVRWLWEPGTDKLGTLGSPGEQAFLAVVGPHLTNPTIPSTTSSTTTTSTTTSTTTTSTTTTSTTTTTVAPKPKILCAGVVATMIGTDGDDVLIGTGGRDVIVALGGNDVIDGRGGDDLICAGSGNDRVLGGRGDDTIYGEAGKDSLKGGSGSDHLIGAAGRDKLYGSRGDDVLDAGRGRDRLAGGPGADLLKGGAGRDRLLGGPGRDRCLGGSGKNVRKSCP